MKYEIKYRPSYSMLVVSLEANEMITAEAGSMTYMTPNIEAHTRKRESERRDQRSPKESEEKDSCYRC